MCAHVRGMLSLYYLSAAADAAAVAVVVCVARSRKCFATFRIVSQSVSAIFVTLRYVD